jgi:hypothetical protein
LAKVTEDIAAATDHFERFAFHRNISFNRFTRAAIMSISRFGVLIPWLDFFWNACTTQSSAPIFTAYTTRKALPR